MELVLWHQVNWICRPFIFFFFFLHGSCGKTFMCGWRQLPTASPQQKPGSGETHRRGVVLPTAEPVSAEPTDRPQLGWKCVKAVRGVCCTVFCQDRVRWLNGAELQRGVLIGGKWQDAQSQQQIIYLTHVEKLLEGLTLQVFSESQEFPDTQAKASHLAVTCPRPCGHSVTVITPTGIWKLLKNHKGKLQCR